MRSLAASLLLGLLTGCRPLQLPAVRPPAVIGDPAHLAHMIPIKSDVDDDVLICLELLEPSQNGPACLLTVGEFRAGYAGRRRAD
jgi:hypothetical protein